MRRLNALNPSAAPAADADEIFQKPRPAPPSIDKSGIWQEWPSRRSLLLAP
jgi:hypothetical protein